MRLHSEKHVCPRRRNPTALKTILSSRQTERDGKAECRAEQSDGHPARCWGSRVASEPLCPREARVGTLRAGKNHLRFAWRSCGGRWQAHLDALVSHELHAGAPVRSAAPIAKDAAARDQPGEDGATRSPASVSSWRSPPIGSGGAKGRGDNCGCWLHTPHAGFHRLLCVARAPQALDEPDSARSHPAGGRSPARRSGQLSRVQQLRACQSPRREAAALEPRAQLSQTRWCAPLSAQADAPVPGARSKSMARRSARLLGKPGE